MDMTAVDTRLERVVRDALAEDVGSGDRTTDALLDQGRHAAAPSCS